MLKSTLVLMWLALSGQVTPAPTTAPNPELAKLVSPDAKVEKLGAGIQFGEGPVWVKADGGYLVFSDVPGNMLKRWDKAKGITDFRKTTGPNGNAVDAQGKLITLEEGGRRITIAEPGADGAVKPLIEKYEGKKLNSPNDLAIGADGTIWFTDPPFGLRGKESERELEKNNVFKFEPKSGALTIVATDFDRPNGIELSPDGKRLYVADAGRPRHIRVFDVTADGKLENGRVFAQPERGNPDGMRCDELGNLWVAAGGITIFSPDGKMIGRITVPENPANLAFGGEDGKTVFMTARTGLYSVKTNVAGASFKKQ
jgi:gluconolactonase